MGSISFSRINRLLRQNRVADRLFGEAPFRPPGITAMRVERDSATGEWIYSGEVPVSFSVALREKAFSDSAGVLHVGRWARLEVQVPEKGSEIGVGWFLTASAYPTSLATTLHARFKRSSRKKRDPSALPFPGVHDSVESLAMAIESLSHDYWEKGAHLTAGVPLPVLGNRETRRERSRLPTNGAWVLGCCQEDPDIVMGDLLRHSVSVDLLERVESGHIIFAPRQAMRRPSQREESERPPFLAPEVKAAAREYLACAVQQALAGPPLRQSTLWLQRPVIGWVDALFRDHLNDKNRVAVRQRRDIASTKRSPELIQWPDWLEEDEGGEATHDDGDPQGEGEDLEE